MSESPGAGDAKERFKRRLKRIADSTSADPISGSERMVAAYLLADLEGWTPEGDAYNMILSARPLGYHESNK